MGHLQPDAANPRTIEDSSFFAYIAAAGEEDDWTDPAVWRKANPGLGVTMSKDQFAEDGREAQESPAKENSFRRYRLNQWPQYVSIYDSRGLLVL